MKKFFVYGSLKSESFQRKIFGRPLAVSDARLHDYQLVLITDFPSVIPYPNRWVDGFLIELNDEDISKADTWEGEDHIRFEAQVEMRNSATYEKCWVYRSLEPHSQEIDDYQASDELLSEVDKYLGDG